MLGDRRNECDPNLVKPYVDVEEVLRPAVINMRGVQKLRPWNSSFPIGPLLLLMC